MTAVQIDLNEVFSTNDAKMISPVRLGEHPSEHHSE